MVTTHTSLLLRLRQADDSAAWCRFVQLYTPLLRHWVQRFGIQDHDCHDLVQEIFLTLYVNASRFETDRPAGFRAWLRTVTVNKCRDLIRRKRRTVEPALEASLEKLEQDPALLLTDQEYNLFVSQAAMRLMRQLFSETTWRACWEHVACNRPARQVGQELGISENAVYLARGRVLKRLREELDGLWDD